MRQDTGLTEQLVSDALANNKGDLIRTSQALGITVGKLHGFVRMIPSLRRLVKELEVLKLEDDYDNLSDEQFRDQMNCMMAVYQLDGLNVIHELATRDDKDNASMADVRLKAAIQLRGTPQSRNDGISSILMELNEAYQQSATKIKGLRASASVTISLDAPQESPALIPDSRAAS